MYRILYIDRGRVSISISEWHKILQEVVTEMGGVLDTLIIGSDHDMNPTLLVSPPKYKTSRYLQVENWFERHLLLFDSVITGLEQLMAERTYDVIISGNTSFMLPLHILDLANISGFITHDQQTELEGKVHPILAAVLEMGGHICPLLEGLKQYYMAQVDIPAERIHVTPIPARITTEGINVDEKYDFSTVISGFPWDNVPLLEKLTAQGGKWLIKTYGKMDVPNFRGDTTIVTKFLPLNEYYELLASAKVGVQVQLRENCCKAIAEHAAFHPTMVFEGANYLADCDDFAISFNEANFMEKARPLLADAQLRKDITERGKPIVEERFSYESMCRGIQHFLDSVKPEPMHPKSKALVLAEKLKEEGRSLSQKAFLRELRWSDPIMSHKTLRRVPHHNNAEMTWFGSDTPPIALDKWFE